MVINAWLLEDTFSNQPGFLSFNNTIEKIFSFKKKLAVDRDFTEWEVNENPGMVKL